MAPLGWEGDSGCGCACCKLRKPGVCSGVTLVEADADAVECGKPAGMWIFRPADLGDKRPFDVLAFGAAATFVSIPRRGVGSPLCPPSLTETETPDADGARVPARLSSDVEAESPPSPRSFTIWPKPCRTA